MEFQSPGFLIELAPIFGTVANCLLLAFVFIYRGLLRSRFVFASFFVACLLWLSESILHGFELRGMEFGPFSSWICSLASISFLIGLAAHFHELHFRNHAKAGF